MRRAFILSSLSSTTTS